ncbi:glutathione S-transferase family protein [Flexibacterium corallicola]|uniref:glutathione S-transferase family protein n=1 Tax=Flexibacterium corallicola TaxID=3037259 RepID=UPI00286F8AC1|nr:glutathione S-transferase family protein [Pseudovibrio sp. M1P-2-3]
MIKIISFKICPFVQRVTALLEAKGLEYTVEYISLKDKPQWFLEISPNGQVPVLVTEDGTALFESEAIVEYIDEISEPLYSGISREQKAINRAWGYLASKNYLVQCSTMRSPTKDVLEERSEKLRSAFLKVEKHLGNDRYFSGKTLGNVDIAWLPMLHRADIIERHRGYDMLEGLPKVKEWQGSVLAKGLAERSVSEDFEEAFTSFYLSDETYLGKGKCCTPSTVDTCSEGTCC